jgi:hypothetical protein
MPGIHLPAFLKPTPKIFPPPSFPEVWPSIKQTFETSDAQREATDLTHLEIFVACFKKITHKRFLSAG